LSTVRPELSKDDPLDEEAWFDRLTTNVWLIRPPRMTNS